VSAMRPTAESARTMRFIGIARVIRSDLPWRKIYHSHDLPAQKRIQGVIFGDLGRTFFNADLRTKINLEFIGRLAGLRKIFDLHDGANAYVNIEEIFNTNLLRCHVSPVCIGLDPDQICKFVQTEQLELISIQTILRIASRQRRSLVPLASAFRYRP